MPSSSSFSSAPPDPGLRQRLSWITAFRTIATTLLLVVLSTRLLSHPPDVLSPEDAHSFALIGGIYALNIAYALPLRRGLAWLWLAYVQILGDVGLALLLITRTGGLESPFTFVFLLVVLSGAILLGRRGAIVACAVGSAVLLFRTGLLLNGVAIGWLGARTEPLPRVGFLLFSNLVGQFLIAWLSSYLSEQLTRTRGRLVEREADLSALARLQRQILDSMPSGLITARQDGMVTYLNRAAGAILGIAPEASALRLDALVPGASAIPSGSLRNELLVPTPGGRKVLGLSVTGLEGDNHDLLIVFQDLTALRRTEDELKRSDHLAALGKLSAQLAHEIRNPLAAMRGSAQLLADETTPEAPTGRLTNILVRESDRLSALVEDFLRFARPSEPQRRATSVHELAAEVIEMLRFDPAAREVNWVKDLHPVEHRLDPDQLRQVLINLLRNACAAAGPSGTVKLGVAERTGSLNIRVWDSAGAIAPGDLPRLFEPFFTRNRGGTGLGLSTVHSIVKAHGGTIQVTSSPAEGTEFLVTLPPQPTEECIDPDRR